jgi:PAS domain S-box-containing protein
MHVSLNDQQFHAMLNALNDVVIIIDENNTILACNQAISRIFGHQPSQVIGEPLSLLLTTPWKDQADNYAIHAQGSHFRVTTSLAPITVDDAPCTIVTISDYTTTDEIKRKLIYSQIQLNNLIKHNPGVSYRQGILTNEVIFISHQIEKLTGVSNHIFLNHDMNIYFYYAVVVLHDRERVIRSKEQQLQNTNTFELEYEILHANGKTLWVRESGVRFFDQENRTGWIDGYMLDITDIKDREKALQAAVVKRDNDLQEKEELITQNAKMAAMGEMIGMIAHQWRQPISGIGMSINNMMIDIEFENVDLDKFTKRFEMINEQLHFLSQTIDDFRNFLKPNRERVVCKVSELIDQAKTMMGKSFENHNITINEKILSDCDVNVYKNEVVQVILNLLKNAQDILIDKAIEPAIVEIGTYVDDEYVSLYIQDNAGGVPKAIIEQVFDPYFSTKEAKNGTGLGLYMSKTIIEEHHQGLLRVQNMNDGARFTIILRKEENHE